jgi:hypothetical protein
VYKLVVEVVAVECVGGEVILVQKVLLYSVEVLSEVAEVVGLEIVGLEVHRLVTGGIRLLVVHKRIKYILRRTFLLLNFLLASLLYCRLRKCIKIKVSEVIAFIFCFYCCCKVSEL